MVHKDVEETMAGKAASRGEEADESSDDGDNELINMNGGLYV